jgi:hypothetical protein
MRQVTKIPPGAVGLATNEVPPPDGMAEYRDVYSALLDFRVGILALEKVIVPVACLPLRPACRCFLRNGGWLLPDIFPQRSRKRINQATSAIYAPADTTSISQALI